LGSVNSNGNADLYSVAGNLPNIGSAYSGGAWFRVYEYSGGAAGKSLWDFGIIADAAAWQAKTGNGTVGAAGTLIINWQQNGGNDHFTANILTGSDTDWVYVCWARSLGQTSYDWWGRRQGDATFTLGGSVSATDAPTVYNLGIATSPLKIFDDEQTTPHPNVSCRSWKVWTRTLTSAELLQESASLDSVVNSTGIYSFQPFSTVVNAGDDASGNGNNLIIENSLAADSSEPNAALPGPPSPSSPTPQSSLFFGSNV